MNIRKVVLILLFASGWSTAAWSQAVPLSLDSALARVLATHPSVNQAREAISAATERVKLVQSARLPVVDGNANYAHIGPVPEITVPGMGSFQMAPYDNYSATLDVNELIWDFGKTGKGIAIEKANKELAEQSLESVLRKLELITIQSYYSLVFVNYALDIKEEQLDNLKKHLSFIEKKTEAGTATRYDLLSTQVKLARVENEKTDLLAQKDYNTAFLNVFMGRQPGEAIEVPKEFPTPQLPVPVDSLVPYALSHREELIMARQSEKIASLRYDFIRIKRNPGFNFFASGGLSDGYFPNLTDPIANYAVGVAFHAPIIDGFRKKKDLSIAQSGINTAVSEIDRVRRQMITEVTDFYTQSLSAQKKIETGTIQVEQAKMALDLAQTNYKAGAITNLDLLDSETALSDSRLTLVRARLDYALSLYRLLSSIGAPVAGRK